MTLILTELSPLGIAMAADSAVTYTHRHTGMAWAVPNQARKLQVIPHLNAGISCWGMGAIGGTPTDQWLTTFIQTNTAITTLQGFASALATQLNAIVGPNSNGRERLGFHLAGFESLNGILFPSFFHIHDGPSTALQSRGINVNPSQFNANHDMPPHLCQQILARGDAYMTRNGDYQLYANLFLLLEQFFWTVTESRCNRPQLTKHCRPCGISRIPNKNNFGDLSVEQPRTGHRWEYLILGDRSGWHPHSGREMALIDIVWSA